MESHFKKIDEIVAKYKERMAKKMNEDVMKYHEKSVEDTFAQL